MNLGNNFYLITYAFVIKHLQWQLTTTVFPYSLIIYLNKMSNDMDNLAKTNIKLNSDGFVVGSIRRNYLDM
ncbi:hypothetical protein DICVIV_00565 [Dictyocaulus viviparus]|uniref:Uncharacterized protein n=1 Tax=Dictyocaulus viviparus TaxID=29172 RepID=A0A0D8YB67_DICVI|nr:hypothetical protein DICVIV_00565 [Dictyocaulus viviparus]